MRIIEKIKTYFILTKPRLWGLLLYTGIAGYIIGARSLGDLRIFTIIILSILAGTAGANTITSYIDRDIDAIMERTKHRPIPKRLIDPPAKALYFGGILSLLALATSYIVNIIAFSFMLFGLFDNIIVYSYLTKRKTYWNIILGSFSGGSPVVIGYAAATGLINIEALIWAAFIVIWTPIHIWSLALYFRKDYRKAGVPMLPAVVDIKSAIRCIASSAIIMVGFNLLLPIVYPKYLNLIYLIPSIIMDIIILYWSTKLLHKPKEKLSWKLFKITSPYLGIVFTLAMIISVI